MNDTRKVIYVTSKLDNEEYCKTNGHFTKHLRKNNISYQQYYEKYVSGIEEKCAYCGSPETFYQRDHSYGNTCGSSKCIGQEISKTKSEWTEVQKLSDSHNKKVLMNSRSKDEVATILEKRKQTNIEKYGVAHSTQSDNNKEKSRKTKLEKYGNEFYSGWEKSAKKNRNKSPEEQNEINDARRKTNIELFGVGCSFLRPDVIKKSQQGNARGKEYILPSGRIVSIRGYENLALDELFRQGHKEEQLVIHNKLEKYKLPIFDYISGERQHLKYYPDIYIPDENLIIEVKSQWWWDAKGRPGYEGRLINNIRKAESVKSRGYRYEVWLYKEDKREFEIL